MKIIVMGAHPDDPETGCGGTIIKCTQHKHEVIALYMTKGESGISNKSHSEAAHIRVAEARRACTMMGCTPLFMSQIDGHAKVTDDASQEMIKIV